MTARQTLVPVPGKRGWGGACCVETQGCSEGAGRTQATWEGARGEGVAGTRGKLRQECEGMSNGRGLEGRSGECG